MKLISSPFVASGLLAVLSLLAGCSSDNSGGNNTAGAGPGGASGKAGSAGSSAAGASAAGASAAGASAAGASAAGAGGGGGASTAGGSNGGASAATGGAPAVEASFATVKNIISTTCFGNGCHGQEGNPLQMKVDDTLYMTLMTHMTQNCGKLVNTASPSDSALVKLLKGDCGTPPNVTPRMPFQTCFDGDTDPDSPCVQPDKIAAILAWITKGAPQQ